MLDVNTLQAVIADTFFGGSTEVAGVMMFVMALLIIIGLTRNILQSLLLSMPIMFIFTLMNILPTDVTILMIIVAVLGVAFLSRQSMMEG